MNIVKDKTGKPSYQSLWQHSTAITLPAYVCVLDRGTERNMEEKKG